MTVKENLNHHLFTSESVAPGHPDKICDQISDGILDAILAIDRNAKVACEAFITTNFLLIGGEVHSTKLATINIKELAEKTAKAILIELGYDNDEIGFNANTCEIKVLIHEQSPEILHAVEQANHQIGAGDQGIMFGYACLETKNYMPLAIVLAHELLIRANELRKKGLFKYARVDMKAQVTIDQEDKNNLQIHTMLMSVQHTPDCHKEEFEKFIKEEIMFFVAKKYQLNLDFNILINPTGKFVIGGPTGDTGLTGRKIIVDTYGGKAPHGGGAFSGKDPTKVDRSGAYFARYIAKNIVAAELAKVCEVQLAYAIGMPNPISVFVDTSGTVAQGLTEKDLIKIICENFDCSIKGIIDHLQLLDQKYQPLAVFGHFGREDLNLAWEKLDKVETLKRYLIK
ncbi:methionine adenosyltransferase [Spiroplasma platyhelix]|uniref:S-adenosylmethionine synthase n=1 Tax=Spiroplasma platyhelix PALS-1 TaxID=1276218 RepID=A0A846TWM5_9MOLU|nr:methionine adenosyltransferase [Spiroplasma platyhelix]MBE4704061.1 S-adenosylmethionine synthase [Spiroplasma platyhelix PALS-1]NKE38431.1 methionine adenosyltransferase [Spiroplasma platyhelix PALS-1]UJB29319.1 S-adenosylmethionine synthetase [Spiroplasma platyhelix PALS-1]